jgi:hypothetical protein
MRITVLFAFHHWHWWLPIKMIWTSWGDWPCLCKSSISYRKLCVSQIPRKTVMNLTLATPVWPFTSKRASVRFWLQAIRRNIASLHITLQYCVVTHYVAILQRNICAKYVLIFVTNGVPYGRGHGDAITFLGESSSQVRVLEQLKWRCLS